MAEVGYVEIRYDIPLAIGLITTLIGILITLALMRRR